MVVQVVLSSTINAFQKQVFYICVGSGPGEAMLCPNGTLFSQDFLVCDWWFNIDCRPYS